MLTIEKTVLPSPEQWEIIIEGMRNPMNSWDRMDSGEKCEVCNDCGDCVEWYNCHGTNLDFVLGENDHKLMMNLAKAGTEHSKYRRMLPIITTVTAPLYFWKESDTYAFKVQNGCSTMHKIHAKEFTMDDFSHEHLGKFERGVLQYLIDALNWARQKFLDTRDKDFWWQMIQLLPSSYNQKRTVMFNYEVLAKIYRERKNHKLDEWHTFCDWIEQLPYSELITGNADE